MTEQSFSKELVWNTGDGRCLKISQMDLSHLKNTVRWMERVAHSDDLENSLLSSSLRDLLKKDERYKKMKRRIDLLEKKKIINRYN